MRPQSPSGSLLPARLIQFAMRWASLPTFIVPGPDTADLHGLDLAGAGLEIVSTPRHASVLLIIGEVPAGLAHAAMHVYKQMSQPRAVALLGVAPNPALPPADGVAPLEAQGLLDVATTCRRVLGDALNHTRGSDQESGAGGGTSNMDMGGMAMSMADMTRDLERSADGLPMEWLEATYGPLFPGLPGGLRLRLKLDGDTVARASADVESLRRDCAATWAGAVVDFPERFSGLDPLTPVAYRALAWRCLTQQELPSALVRAVERERIGSHLAWLSRLGFVLGYTWLADSAGSLARRLQHEDASDAIRSFVQRVGNQRMLAHRLRSVARLSIDAVRDCSGPTARASGLAVDARASDPIYQALGFGPILRQEGDALARLQVRLEEIQQSLGLVDEFGTTLVPPESADLAPDGAREAVMETPRGTATLRIRVHAGLVAEASVITPSEALLSLVPRVSHGAELSDALVGIASLDLSAWDVAA